MSALAAPLLWLAFDAAATGDPPATTHRAEALRGRGRSWADVLEALVDRISPLGFALGALGIAGFVLHARARGRAGALLPAATIVVWPVVLVVEANRGFPIAYRYLLPAIVAVALGVGFLVARLVPRVLPAWAATALAATGVVVLTLTTRFDAETSALRVHRILAAAPGVERTLDCGTVAVAGPDRPSRADMGALSAATRRSLRSFALAPPAPARGGVLLLAGAEFEPPRDGANDVFRSDVWPSRRTARRNIGPWRSLASSRLNHMRSRLEMWRTRSSSIRDGTWLSITGREWKGRRTRLARRTAPSRGGYRSGLTRQGRPGRLTSMRSRWLARASSA